MKWRDIVGAVAPTLATAIGGPLAPMATGVIMDVLGIDSAQPDAQKQLAKTVTTASPEVMARLKKAEQDFQVRLKELDIDLERVHAGDRDSAREREKKVGGKANSILAGIIVLGFFGVIGYVFHFGLDDVKPAQMGLIGTLIGYVSAKADQVVAYYFGSSSSSARKTELISRSQPAP